jgi:acetyl esterase/lipase
MNLFLSLGLAILELSTPGSVTVRQGVAYGPGDRGRLDVYAPRHPTAHAPVAVFMYGGSWQSGAKSMYRFVGVALASRGIVTVIPDYRVYPEVRYPVFLQDNALAVAFAKAHAAEWGADPTKLYLIGHSAGAYNAAMLATDNRWLGPVGLEAHRDIRGVYGLAGPYDFLPLKDPVLKTIFGPQDQLPDTQPINHVDRSTPPMRLVAGDRDSTVDPGNSLRMAAALQAKGVIASARIYPGLTHVSLLTSLSGLFRGHGQVLNDIATFVNGEGFPRTSALGQTESPLSSLQPRVAGARS